MHAPADFLGHLDQMVGQSRGTMIERSADRTYAVHLRGCTSSWATGTQGSRRESMAGSSGQGSCVMNDRNACSKTMLMHLCRASCTQLSVCMTIAPGKSQRDHEDASTLAERNSAPLSRASRAVLGGGSKGSNPHIEVMGSECMNQATNTWNTHSFRHPRQRPRAGLAAAVDGAKTRTLG